jgi:Zn-dependent protease
VVRRTRISAPRRFSRSPRTVELGMFSREEIRDLIIATLVLAVAFAFAMGSSGFGNNIIFSNPIFFAYLFPITLLVTGTAFTLHEMSHKFMAQKHGLPAEFVMSQTGIIIALITGVLIGFLFALPGAVVFSGAGADKKTVGKVGAAGPAVNILIALSLFPFMLLSLLQSNVWIAFTLYMVVYINFFLAGFNMIPYGPLDGLKVWKWNPAIYILMMGIIAVGFLFTLFFIPIPWPL